MEEHKFILIKPNEIRKRFTEFVYQNKPRALMPTKVLRKYKQQHYNDKSFEEESKSYYHDTSRNSYISGQQHINKSSFKKSTTKTNPNSPEKYMKQ
jgi:hypothetical protein